MRKIISYFSVLVFCVTLLLSGAPFAFAASVYVSPGSGSYSVGSTIKVTVRTNTDGQAVNSVEASIGYSSDTLEVVSVAAGSSFPMQTPGSPSHSGGRVFLSGGVPSPGYTGGSGNVGTITFRAKAVGEATVSVLSAKTLLNDGQGTNAFSGSSGARFTITPPPLAGPTVTSSTHPNPESWYSNKDVTLSWSRPGNATGYSFDFNQDAATIPNDTVDSPETSKTYTGVSDGVWYFHIKARSQTGGFGATTHFAVRIDTQVPQPFELHLVGQTDVQDVAPTPTVEFNAIDAGSGIDKYDAYVDGKLVAEKVASPYTYEKLEGGPHVLKIVATDKAGNAIKSELSIIVTAPQAVVAQMGSIFERTIQMPVLILVGMNLLIIVLLIIIIILLWRRKKQQPEAIDLSEIQKQLNNNLDELKQHLNTELQKYTECLTPAGELKVREKIKNQIKKTEAKFDKELEPIKRKVRKKQA